MWHGELDSFVRKDDFSALSDKQNFEEVLNIYAKCTLTRLKGGHHPHKSLRGVNFLSNLQQTTHDAIGEF